MDIVIGILGLALWTFAVVGVIATGRAVIRSFAAQRSGMAARMQGDERLSVIER